MEKIKTILWDLDGTILDSFSVLEAVLREISPQHGRKVPDRETMKQHFHGSLEDTLHNVYGGLSDAELSAILKSFLEVQVKHYETIEHHILSDAAGLAKRAHEKGIKQIIVTNRKHAGRLSASPRSIVQNSSLSALIDEVICGDDNEYNKPNSGVLGNLKIVASETAVVGDQYVDAEFAKNLGARVILVSRDTPEPAHMDRLGAGWEKYVTIVRSLQEVEL